MSEQLKRSSWNFFSGTQLTFGPRAIGTLANVITRRKAQRVLLISDPVLETAGLVGLAMQVIEQTSAKLQVFTEGEVEPSTNTVEAATTVAREFDPDLFVGLGGGSNMDLAKTCCAMTGLDCSAESLLGFDNVPGPIPPLVCIPTTSGTGSEVSHSAVLKNSTTGKKDAVLSHHIRPDIAIVDPYLTISCPETVTAESGINALTHAIEAYLVTNFYSFTEDMQTGLPYEGNNPLGDLHAEKAIRLIGQHLPKVMEDPDQLASRSGMSLAATLAGVAFSNCGVGLANALEYPVGAIAGCSHGIGNGIVLPEVLRYLKQHRAGRLARIGELLGADRGLDNDEAAEAAIEAVQVLREKIGLPTRLSEVGISEDQLPELASKAFSLQRFVDLTPGPPAEADGLAILKACY